MKITAPLLTLGQEPDIVFTDNGMMVKLSVAENYNRNFGTKEDPDWQQIGTGWYNMVAFGDTASAIVDQLTQGESFKLISGVHKKKNIGSKDEPDWRNNYVIWEFEKVEKKNDDG